MEINLQNNPQEATSDEKLLAMLSHLSIFLGGIILPIIIWATQKDKSKFVRFHSLQAIFYHLAYAVIIILFIIVFALVMIIAGAGTGIFNVSKHGNDSAMPGFLFIAIIIFYAGLFICIFAGIGYAIYLGIKAYQGRLIKIPIIGNIVFNKVYGQV